MKVRSRTSLLDLDALSAERIFHGTSRRELAGYGFHSRDEACKSAEMSALPSELSRASVMNTMHPLTCLRQMAAALMFATGTSAACLTE